MAQAELPDPTDQAVAEESFEALFARLEEVTEQLEAGDVALDRAVALYEEGMTLAQRCQRLLAEAEQRIEQLREAYDGTDAS
ncbi:MAG: exodeoxyribonuclease VII small subunit [Chloroflexi bacterium]|nr:exodeoxyribonuclease VII small subunit [Chloroflexota bacterium]